MCKKYLQNKNSTLKNKIQILFAQKINELYTQNVTIKQRGTELFVMLKYF